MEEIDENTLEYALNFKPKLRFDCGDIVYLKSDLKRKCPMVVAKVLPLDDESDYLCEWATSQKDIVRNFFIDKVLCI